MEARISSLARPVTVARLAERDVAVCVVLAQRMFLTSCYVLRPVTSVRFLVVEKAADTELFRGRSVPAGPVTGAGCLVSENAVQPVAVLRALGWIFFFSFPAVCVMRIVANSDEPVPSGHLVVQTVRAALKESLSFVAFIVKITLAFMSHSSGSVLAALRTSWVSCTPGWISQQTVGVEGLLPRPE